MAPTILFIVYLCICLAGGFLALKRTGNYDVDFFTKIIGWVMLMFGVYGIFELIKTPSRFPKVISVPFKYLAIESAKIRPLYRGMTGFGVRDPSMISPTAFIVICAGKVKVMQKNNIAQIIKHFR